MAIFFIRPSRLVKPTRSRSQILAHHQLTISSINHITMYIYNITFNVENSIEQEWLDFVKKVFIPKMLKSGLITGATTAKIVVDEAQGTSYSIQFFTDKKENLDHFINNEFQPILQEIHDKFSPEMLYFATELDVIDRQ